MALSILKSIDGFFNSTISTPTPYDLYQKFIWDTKNNENEKSRNKKYLLTAG
jgi:hypothetical protein